MKKFFKLFLFISFVGQIGVFLFVTNKAVNLGRFIMLDCLIAEAILVCLFVFKNSLFQEKIAK
jgi:hypothetical protein